MTHWRRLGRIWALWPTRPNAVIEMIGGTYLAAGPQVSYRRLLEGLIEQNLAVHAWVYVPTLDHQVQAREAWQDFRQARELLAQRLGGGQLATLRLGHSLGCKLHLLAPDGGRSCRALVTLSFNNFAADRSIPLLKDLAPQLGIKTGFSPSPWETLRLIRDHYVQERNLVVRFGNDALDQSTDLLNTLRSRHKDCSCSWHLPGNHLTPASFGLRRQLLGTWAEDTRRRQIIERLQEAISNWAMT